MTRSILAASSALALVFAASGTWAAGQDAQEVLADAAPASLGTSLAGELVEGDSRSEENGLFDRYVLDLQAGTRVEIIMRSDAFDPYLIAGYLGGGEFEQIGFDDDGLGEGLNSRLRFTAAETGQYEIRARGFAAMGEGAYTLTFGERAAPAQTQAFGSIAVGGEVQGALTEGDTASEWDETYLYDEYRFSARAGDRLEATAISETFDTTLEIWSENRWGVVEQLAYDDDGFMDGTTNSRARFYAPHDGDYSIRVSSYGGGAAGDYRLNLNALAPLPAPTPVTLGQPLEGALLDDDPETDYGQVFDSYSFSAPAGARLEIVARSLAFDTVLELGRREGAGGWTSYGYDDDGLGEGTDSRLRYTLEEGGEYEVRVMSLGTDGRGAYSFSVIDRGPPPPPPPPGSMGVGDSVSGELADNDGVSEDERLFDEYDIQTRAGQRLAVTLRSDVYDTLVEIYRQESDGSWSMVTSDDDSAGDLDSRAILTAQGGVYRVRATSYGMGEMGAYVLSTRDLGEPARPRPIRLGRSVDGALTESDALAETEVRYDSYGFSLGEGERAQFIARSDAFDTFLVVTQSDGTGGFTYLTYDDDGLGDGTTNSRLIFTAETAGDYELWVLPLDPEVLGAYSLESRALGPTPVSGPIQFGSTVNGSLADGDGITWDGMNYDGFTFQGVAGQRIRLEMSAPEFDTYLLLGQHFPDGLASIAEDDDGMGEGTNSRLTFTLPENGLYEVWATSYAANETGAYSLTLTDLGPAPQPGSLVIGSTVRGELSDVDPTDEYGSFYDAYRFQAYDGQRVRITLTSNEFDAFIHLGQMTDGVFTGELSDDDGLSDLNSRLDFTADGRNEYVLRVRSYSPGETGEYVLSVEDAPAEEQSSD